MIIDLLRLRNGIDKKILIDEYHSFSKEELDAVGVTEMNNVHIEGEISLNSLKELYLSLEVTGIMVIPCAITLKPVECPINVVIEGDLSEIHENYEENDKNYINSLDILPIIWENILMEIPMRVIAPDAELSVSSGDGWRIVTDEEEHVNSELSKLTDLLQDSEVR